VKRRTLLLALVALGLAVGGRPGLAQERRPDAVVRIAFLDSDTEAARAPMRAIFMKRLAELEFVEGRNLAVDRRFADGDAAQLAVLAAELVALKPDVLVTTTTTVALTAKAATSTIPIVAMGPADPVASGLVASLPRPGGNLTGVAYNQAEISTKWVQLARELVPRARSIAYLTDTNNPGEMLVFRNLDDRARPLGLKAQALDGTTRDKVDHAFATIRDGRIDVLVVATTASLLPQRQQIVDAAARLVLPAIYARREYTRAGGLLSLGANPETVPVRGAEQAAQILRGAKPAEMPFEMASSFQFVVNAKAVKALGLKLPPAVLARVTEVIE
jgi:putative tryptophan/tyrosine transport system substrate-binding protein